MSLKGYKPKWKRRAYLGPAAEAKAGLLTVRMVMAAAIADTAKKIKKYTASLCPAPRPAHAAARFPRRKPKTRRIRGATTETARRRAIYAKRVKVWLTEPGHQFCWVCIALMQAGEDVDQLMATQCHHKFGRRGNLLLWEKGWIPVSQFGHEWVHNNPKAAIKLGLLGETGTWNDFKKALQSNQQPKETSCV
jgi:hypothetical protein